jgi:hypothetical protein
MKPGAGIQKLCKHITAAVLNQTLFIAKFHIFEREYAVFSFLKSIV